MIGHNKQQQPLVDSSTQQRIRPPLPTPNSIPFNQFNQSGTLYIPSDGHLNQINEYNTIRTNKKNSLDRSQLFSTGIENTYHEPQLLVGPQHSNNNNIYNSTNSGNSGGSTTNNTFNSMSNASNVAFAGPNSATSFSTFARLGSGVAPYGNNNSTLCAGANNLSNFTTAFSGTGSALHHHLSMAGSSGIGLSSSSKNPLCRFAGSTQHACLKFFCGQSVANGLWKASTFVLLIICILLTTFLLMGNQLNSDNQLPCPSSSTLMDDLKNELNKHNKQTQLTNNIISNRNLLPTLANNKRNKINTNEYSSLNKKLFQAVGPNQAETYERIQLDKVFYKLLHPYSHWNFQLDRTNLASLLRFNYTFDKVTSRRQNLSLIVYAAKNRLPSSTRYDFVEYIDTPSSLINNELSSSGRDESNSIFNPFFSTTSNVSLDSVRTRLSLADQLETREFLQYLDSGVWFISVINDQNTPVELAFQIKASETTCPMLCSNNGRYVHGECQCEAGFKGKECELSSNECEVSDCNGHGYCMDGKCFCYPGYKGDHCKEIDCLDPFCSGHGQCINGMCVCHMGYRSADCSEKVNDICAQNTCSSHGQLDQLGQCICESGWTGSDCSIQKCSLDCGSNGSCENNVCVCKSGFSGSQCQDKQCSVHCHLHGQCLNNGTCLCSKGYNGRHCTLDGCANNCNGQGQCVRRNEIWQCECNSSASGEFCEIPIETDCSDKMDNDNDGLIDCADSECCSNPVCAVASESFCINSPDPLDILLRKQPPALTASFFQRMQFLIEENSVQSYAQKHAFNESRASVIRGQVVDHHGNGLIGVRVGLANQQQPTVGFVITRRNGHFDLMVNGGGAVILHLLRDPFQPTTQSVNVPWNSIVVLDPIQMQLQLVQANFNRKTFNSTAPTSAGRSKILYFNSPTQTLTTATRLQTSVCLDHDYEKMRFIVLNEKCYSTLCVNGLSTGINLNNAIVNSKSSGNLNLKAYKNLLGLHASDTALSVQSGLTASSSLESSYERLSLVEESVKVPGTDLNLVYSSNHADGYLMLIRLQLTPNRVSNNLLFVHVNIKIEGNLIEKKLEAEPNLIYNYGWDKRNVYRQKVYGLTNAQINVGYEYLHCDQIIWETKRVQIRANDLPITEVGGLFNLDIHHRYNLQQGILQKGNGENLYMNQMNQMMIGTILGDGTQRPLHCTYCNGDLNLSHTIGDQNNNYQNEAHKRLLAPVALAASNDGSIFVGDFNLIRKINLRTGKITTIIELNSSQVAYKYHLTISPADNRLYFSDPEKYQIFAARSTTLDDPTSEDEPDSRENLELVAGNGIKCLPGDKTHCGDRKSAKQAKLSYPKALAINLIGEIFIADGTNIRYIDTHGIIHTLIGDHLSKGHWRPFPCNMNAQLLSKIYLRWPTELAINPVDNQLYILDDHMVFKLTNDRRLQIVAGRPAHCAKQNDLDGQFDSSSSVESRNDQFNLTSSFTSNSNNQQTTWSPANSIYLETPQAIAFTSQGNLLIAESDSQTVNRVRIILNHRNHQLIGDYVGRHQSSCNCMEMNCDCFDRELNVASNAKLSTISAITVTPSGDLIIADQGNLRIRRVNQNNLPQPVNSNGDYEILSTSTNEIYVFNKYGQHMQTKSSLNKNVIYSFTYNVNNSFGKLSSVTESENNKKLNFLRDPHGQVKMIESNSNNNLKINMAYNKLRLLSEVNLNNGNLIKFDYHRNTGLLKNRLDKLGNNMERSVVYEYDEFGRLINKSEN